ncbi:hypothetical protein F5X99DRAFT_403803 [Biscogniauxia marginata]|nr:hypothetical protein F5X99DRAFT_403803 [Biscogniauxia marginata]
MRHDRKETRKPSATDLPVPRGLFNLQDSKPSEYITYHVDSKGCPNSKVNFARILSPNGSGHLNMCRLMVFSGTCTKCGTAQTWDDLTQELSCLEAKNAGVFGECSKGVQVDEHDFDQECDQCAEEDEGVGDISENGAGRGGDMKRQRI